MWGDGSDVPSCPCAPPQKGWEECGEPHVPAFPRDIPRNAKPSPPSQALSAHRPQEAFSATTLSPANLQVPEPRLNPSKSALKPIPVPCSTDPGAFHLHLCSCQHLIPLCHSSATTAAASSEREQSRGTVGLCIQNRLKHQLKPRMEKLQSKAITTQCIIYKTNTMFPPEVNTNGL